MNKIDKTTLYKAYDKIKSFWTAKDWNDTFKLEQAIEMPSLPYIVFKGNSLSDLRPCAAFENKDKAIEYCEHDTDCTYYEVTYMPENDVDVNDVVWRNFDVTGTVTNKY